MVRFEIADVSQDTGWLDITQYWAFESLTEEENDIDGANAGRTLDGLMIRDKVGEKEKFKFESIYIPISVAQHLKALVRQEFFLIRTNLRAGQLVNYTVYAGTRTMGYKLAREDGTELVKLSFNMIQR